MKLEELYTHITSQLTPEEALKRLLSSSLRTYEKLKFPTPEEAVDPVILIALASMDMGWDFLVEKKGDGTEPLRGLTVGTREYMNEFRPVNKSVIDDIDFIAAQLEDVLHGEEGKRITAIRALLIKLKNK